MSASAMRPVRDRLSYPAKDPRPIPVSGLSFQEPLD
jgi:hypothetical protein